MIHPTQIMGVSALKSEDAAALRTIVTALIKAIDSLREDVEALKVSSAQSKKPQYENYGARR